MIQFEIPVILQAHTNQQDIVNFPLTKEQTILETIQQLLEHYPSLKNYLISNNHLTDFVSFYLNGKDIRYLSGETTPVNENDKITLIVAMAGG